MDLKELAALKAQERGLDPSFVQRLIGWESSWNPNAKGTSGERGLMQLMPATARRFGAPDSPELFQPNINIDAGTKYLATLSKLFGGNQHLMSMAYNAGEGRVQRLMARHGRSPEAIFPHLPAITKTYTLKVAGPLAGHTYKGWSAAPSGRAAAPVAVATSPLPVAAVENSDGNDRARAIYDWMFSMLNRGKEESAPAVTFFPGIEPLPTVQELLPLGDLAMIGLPTMFR